MTKTTLKAIGAAALIGLCVLSLPAPAEAGRGWGHCGYYGHGGWGYGGWGAGLVGLGVGAAVGAALVAPRVYVGPPPPAYYGPVAYGPEPWTPDWYTYCAQRYRSFNPHTGYFIGPDRLPYFCQ